MVYRLAPGGRTTIENAYTNAAGEPVRIVFVARRTGRTMPGPPPSGACSSTRHRYVYPAARHPAQTSTR